MTDQQRESADSRRTPLREVREDPGAPSPFVRWLSVLLDHRRSLILASLAGAILFGALATRRPVTYTSASQVIVDSRRANPGLSDIAAQLGWSSFAGDGPPPPQFYADLMISRSVLGAVIDSVYTFQNGTEQVSGDLIEIFEIQGPNPALRREEAIKVLRERLSRSVATRTGVISVAVKTPFPELSPLVVQRVIGEVNRINIDSRQSQAGGEREFTGRRMAEAASELRAAEQALQTFLEHNRAGRTAPRTAMEEDRLMRAVTMRQAIYTSVAQAYEQARIDEARDTPLLRIVEPPAVPVIRDARGRARSALFGLLLGGVLMGLVVLLRAFFARTAIEDPAGYSSLTWRLRETRSELLRPWRLFRRRRSVPPEARRVEGDL